MLHFLIKSRIWVALAAAALCSDIWLANNSGLPLISVIHVFFLTLSGYLFVDPSRFSLRKPLIYIALTGAVFGVLTDPLFNLWPLVLATGLLLLYKTSWLNETRLNLSFEFRNRVGLKNVVIAICWILISSASYLHKPQEQPSSVWWWLFANFLFVFVLSVAEDVQDIQRDGTATIASTLGKNKTWVLCSFMLLFSAVIVISQEADSLSQLVHVSLCAVTVFLLIYLRKPRNRELASFFIDGLIVLKGFLPLIYHAWL